MCVLSNRGFRISGDRPAMSPRLPGGRSLRQRLAAGGGLGRAKGEGATHSSPSGRSTRAKRRGMRALSMAGRPQPSPPSLRSSSPWKEDNAVATGRGGKDGRRPPVTIPIPGPASPHRDGASGSEPTTLVTNIYVWAEPNRPRDGSRSTPCGSLQLEATTTSP